MDTDDDDDSLFGSEASNAATVDSSHVLAEHVAIASRQVPSIPGMFFFPELLSREVHDQVLHQVSACGYFAFEDEGIEAAQEQDLASVSSQTGYRRSPRNQAMLFARSLPSGKSGMSHETTQQNSGASADHEVAGCLGLPAWAVKLILHLQQLVSSMSDDVLPRQVKDLIFPADQLLSRQLILNLYKGAEGLASHVDLVNRFADGILLCSFGPQGTGTVMSFTHDSKPAHHLFLPSGSVLLLSGEARYDWKHGISARHSDLVRSANLPNGIDRLDRSIRLSITIRTMLPGADIVGE